jgi:hypothetical protein
MTTPAEVIKQEETTQTKMKWNDKDLRFKLKSLSASRKYKCIALFLAHAIQ